MSFTQRVQQLKPEGAYHMLARAQQLEASGRKIIHLEVGEPDFLAAPHIVEGGVRAIAEGRTRYNPPAGVPELREVIAEDASRRRGIDIPPDRVVISPGAKPNLFFPTLALVEPGDEVIYPDPGFPTYRAMIEVAGGIPVPVPVVEENGFSLDLDGLDRAISRKTRLIILNSPGNPTGGVIPLQDLEHIADTAIRHNLWVISDEIYSRIVYDGLQAAPSLIRLPGMAERTVVVDGFSKTYAMTGWRLGYGIMPEALAERVQLLFTHAFGCSAHFTQHAALEALRGDQGWVGEMVAAYQQRRDRIVAGLNAIPGVSCLRPQGAFYAFPNVRSFGRSSDDLATLLLEEAGVALLPGTAFGQYGEGYLRLSYANSIENIELALEQMGRVLGNL